MLDLERNSYNCHSCSSHLRYLIYSVSFAALQLAREMTDFADHRTRSKVLSSPRNVACFLDSIVWDELHKVSQKEFWKVTQIGTASSRGSPSTTLSDTGMMCLGSSLSSEDSAFPDDGMDAKHMDLRACQDTSCSTEGDVERNLSLKSYAGESSEVKETISYMDEITNYALEEWLKKNRIEFADGESCINLDLLFTFFFCK